MKYLIVSNETSFSVWVYTPNALPKEYTLLGESVATNPVTAVKRWLSECGNHVDGLEFSEEQYRFGKWLVSWES